MYFIYSQAVDKNGTKMFLYNPAYSPTLPSTTATMVNVKAHAINWLEEHQWAKAEVIAFKVDLENGSVTKLHHIEVLPPSPKKYLNKSAKNKPLYAAAAVTPSFLQSETGWAWPPTASVSPTPDPDF